MEYRRLGRTELQVSLLGIGAGYLAVLDRPTGEQIYRRAYELGINYFDGRYGDSNYKLAPLLRDHRDQCIVATKTRETGASGVARRVEEELVELGTDYVDLFFLRTYSHQMLAEHLAPGGAFDGVLKAREQGKVRFVGMAAHGDLTVLEAGIRTGLVDAVIFPFNIVRREALDSLIPLAQEYDVGLVVMKPVSVGMLPAEQALPWLANQPIHTMVPGVSSLDQLELDARVLERSSMPLTNEEEAQVEMVRQRVDPIACRICDGFCSPCPEGIDIPSMIYHDVWYNLYRNMGLDAFLTAPWHPGARKLFERHFRRRLERLAACTACRQCEARCAYGIPVVDMLEDMKADHPPLIEALAALGWESEETQPWGF